MHHFAFLFLQTVHFGPVPCFAGVMVTTDGRRQAQIRPRLSPTRDRGLKCTSSSPVRWCVRQKLHARSLLPGTAAVYVWMLLRIRSWRTPATWDVPCGLCGGPCGTDAGPVLDALSPTSSRGHSHARHITPVQNDSGFVAEARPPVSAQSVRVALPSNRRRQYARRAQLAASVVVRPASTHSRARLSRAFFFTRVVLWAGSSENERMLKDGRGTEAVLGTSSPAYVAVWLAIRHPFPKA